VENILDIIKDIPDLKMYLIGKPIYPWGTNLVRTIKSMKIENKLSVLGHRSDVMKYIFSADVIILPTKVEAMPRVLIESMAIGTPIIATDVDGIPELVKHGINGLLYSPDDRDGLLSCLKRIYVNNEERENFAQIGSEIYWSKFTRELQTKRYIQLINGQ